MQQYFIHESIHDKVTITDKEVLHHMNRVMRMKKGDQIALCGSEGACYQMEITYIEPSLVRLKRMNRLKDIKHPLDITLAQSLIRKTPFELTLQKAVELGVETFIPLETTRTVVNISASDEEKKQKRFEKIAREASEQSRRSTIASIGKSIDVNAIDTANYTHVFVPYENEDTLGAKTAFEGVEKGDSVLLIIGPEGGFTAEEIKTLRNKGASIISLGPRILRSETAALYALSALSYEMETC